MMEAVSFVLTLLIFDIAVDAGPEGVQDKAQDVERVEFDPSEGEEPDCRLQH